MTPHATQNELPSLDDLLKAIAEHEGVDELVIHVAADRRLLDQLEAAYALMGRRRMDAGIHLASLCRRHGVPPSYFEERVRVLVHVLNLAPQPDDLYGILGLKSDASQEEVKRAFRRLSRQWHPDVNPGRPEAAESFMKIHQAYQVLGDPDLRRHYDRQSRVPVLKDPGRGGSAEAPNRRSRRWSRHFGYPVAALVALLLAVTLMGDFQGFLTRRYYAGKSTSRKPATEPAAAPAAAPTAAPAGIAEQAAPAPRKGNPPPAATPSPQGLSVLLHPLETASEDLGRDLNVRVPADTRPAEADTRPAEKPSPEEGSKPARIAKASFNEPAGRTPALGRPPAPPNAAPPPEPNREPETAPGSAPAAPAHSRLKEPEKPEGPRRVVEAPRRVVEAPKRVVESPAPEPPSRSGGTVSAEAEPAASPKSAAGRSDAAPPPLISVETTEAHISSFLDRYCRTFSRMDLEGFLNLFTPDARENGKLIGSLRSQYERNFARTEQLAYRIRLERWSYSKDTIRVTGRFDLVALFHDHSGVHSDGRVILSLVPHREGFRVASLEYTFLHSEKIKRE